MLASTSFYSKQILKSIQPYIRNSNATSLPHLMFPLMLTQATQASSVNFYKKYLVSKLHKQLFLQTLKSLQQPKINQPADICHIEPKFHTKMLSHMMSKSTYLRLQSVKILGSKIINVCEFKGVFIHRSLNMPSQCYSIEQKNKKNFIFRMRNKMAKLEHIRLLASKKQQYDADNYRLQRFYMDSYENFIQKQDVARYLVEINAQLKGSLVIQNTELKLPLNKQKPITNHLLQIEQISVPGRSDIQNTLVTDIDYFMLGNPYTSCS